MAINEQGFDYTTGLFCRSTIDKIICDIKKVFDTYCNHNLSFEDKLKYLFKNDFQGFVGCANSCQYLPSLFSLASSELLLNKLKSLGVLFPIINTRPLLSFSSKHTSVHDNYWKVPSHQDWLSMQGSINGITCWIPLVDVSREMGALQICPKSHLLGKLPHEDNGVPYIEKFDGDFQDFPMHAGDALFFNTFTVHRSGNNISDKIRISAHFRYDDCVEKTFIERKYPRHRIEKRKEGDLYPDFPSKEQIANYFSSCHIQSDSC